MRRRPIMHNSLTYNGISSEQLGLRVERIPNANRPARKFDRYSVPGRNGDIIVMQDAWENVEQSYEIWWGKDPGDAVKGGYTLSSWLFGSEGYLTLTDTIDPDHFRKAVFVGPFDVENTLMRYGRATITFDCDPRRFLMSGLTPIKLTENTWETILNPTPFPAKPTFYVNLHGETFIEVEVNYDYLDLSTNSMSVDYFEIDSENEAVKQSIGNRWYGDVSGRFPTFNPGSNIVRFRAPDAEASVAPNWWTL